MFYMLDKNATMTLITKLIMLNFIFTDIIEIT